MRDKSDKDIVLIELHKTASRLAQNGVDTKGLYYGINERVRKSRCPEQYEDQPDEDKSNVIWKPEDEFVKIFPDELNKIAFGLTGAETLTLIRLISYIDYESGMLKIDKRPLLTKDIIEVTRFSKVTISDIMNSLVLKRILARNKVGRTYQYFANPYIFFKGKFINKTLLEMFKDYKKEKRVK